LTLALNASRVEPMQRLVTAISVYDIDPDTAKVTVRYEKSLQKAWFKFALSPDGRFLAVDSQFRAEVCAAATGNSLFDLGATAAKTPSDVVFSPDSRRLARMMPHSREVEIWDITQQKRVHVAPWPRNQNAARDCAFDGRRLAWVEYPTSPRAQLIRVYDAEAGQDVLTFPVGSSSFVEQVVFDSTGARLAWSENADKVIVADAFTGKELFRLHGHSGWVRGLAFSPDGGKLATSGADSTIRIWDVRPLEEE
jgi:WD40 repeat protein